MDLGQVEILALMVKNLSFEMRLIKCLGPNQGLVEVISNQREISGLREESHEKRLRTDGGAGFLACPEPGSSTPGRKCLGGVHLGIWGHGWFWNKRFLCLKQGSFWTVSSELLCLWRQTLFGQMNQWINDMDCFPKLWHCESPWNLSTFSWLERNKKDWPKDFLATKQDRDWN